MRSDWSFSNDNGTLGNSADKAGINLAAGYGHSFGNFNIAAEGSYINTLGEVDFGAGFKGTLKDGWALSVLPGYKFGDRALMFARLGYAQAKTTGNILTDGLGTSGQTHSGLLYGIGAKAAFNRNLSLTVEYELYDLKGKNYPFSGFTEEIAPKAAGVVLGVQYTL
jgi:opacity protein-like surface antigen